MRTKDSDMFSHDMVTKYDAYKDTGPAIFTTGTAMLGSYGNSEVSNIVYDIVVYCCCLLVVSSTTTTIC